MPRSAVSLSTIDLEKCGPDSPLRQLAKTMRRAPRKNIEHQEQMRLVEWCEAHLVKYPALAWLFAVPNWFGTRTILQGVRAKAEGRKKGVPDLWLPVQRGNHPGLVIEMKSPGRQPTREQKLWLNHLKTQGWLTDICFSFEEARDLILAYLSGKDSTERA